MDIFYFFIFICTPPTNSCKWVTLLNLLIDDINDDNNNNNNKAINSLLIKGNNNDINNESINAFCGSWQLRFKVINSFFFIKNVKNFVSSCYVGELASYSTKQWRHRQPVL